MSGTVILKHGQLTQLAEAAGVSLSFLSEIVNGRKRCPATLAVKLERVSEGVLGEKILSSEWILAGLAINGAKHVEIEGTDSAQG